MEGDDSEDYEEGEEYEDYEESSNLSEATPSSAQSTYDAEVPAQWFGMRAAPSKPGRMTVPANCIAELISVSLSVDNPANHTHVVQLYVDYQDERFINGVVVARLIPQRSETTTPKISIPARNFDQDVTIVVNKGNGAVDAVWMVYLQEDSENSEDIKEENNKQQQAAEEKPKSQTSQVTKKDSNQLEDMFADFLKETKQIKVSQANDAMYKSQSAAKAAELRVARSSGLTQIEIKDIVTGSGITAINNSKVSIKFIVYEQGPENNIIQQTEPTQQLQFQLSRKQISPGIDRGILGMRVGGIRDIIGPGKEILGEQRACPIRARIALLHVE